MKRDAILGVRRAWSTVRDPGAGRSVALAGLVALVFLAVAPPLSNEAGRLILERARAILHLTAGARPPAFPSSTHWIAWPLAGAQAIALRIGHAGNAADELARTASQWLLVLRVLWCLMAGAAVLLAGGLAARIRLSVPGAAPAEGRRPDRGGMFAAAAAAGMLLLAPALAVLVRDLSPALPAAVVLLVLARALVAGGGRFSIGIPAGMLLAWFPFAWPFAIIALAVAAWSGRTRSAWTGAAVLTLLLGVALQPWFLLHPARMVPSVLAEWRREGGWGGPGGPGILGILTAAFALGPVAWILWPAAALRRPGGNARVLALFVAASWAAAILLPALVGIRRPGAIQWAASPLLAVWGAVFVGSLPGRTGRAGRLAAWILLVAAAAAPLPMRLGLERRSRAEADVSGRLALDLPALVGPRALWLSEVGLAAGPADSSDFAGRGFVVPRDSRSPDRFDYVYWPRWYSGFRYVLLSGARVSANLARPDAVIPRRFYDSVARHGDLVREWGTGKEGYRLYRIRDGSAWAQPLTEGELAGLDGSPALTWLLNTLGGIYLGSGDLKNAALLLRKGIDWDPKAPGLYNNLGAVYLREGEFQDAAAAFEKGLREAPGSMELSFNFARACMQSRLYERAEKLLRTAISLRPDYAPAHYEIARSFLAQGKNDLAGMALRRYLELDPSSDRRPQIEAALAEMARNRAPAPLPASRAGVPGGPAAVPDTTQGRSAG